MPETPGQKARQQIDAQLTACGWVVQDYKQFNPSAGRGIALREAPLKLLHADATGSPTFDPVMCLTGIQ